jgi:hypothetical protein
MKIKFKSALCAASTIVVVLMSTAWAAETPKPGKTPEERARNKAELKCKTEYPNVVEGYVASYSGASIQKIKAIMLERFNRDEEAGLYYAKAMVQDDWIERLGNIAFEVGRDLKKDKDMRGLTASQLRSDLLGYTDEYVKSCTETSIKVFLK